MGCVDSDSSPNSDLTYTIKTSSNPSNAFAVSSTGVISVNGALDAETNAVYSLVIQVADQASSSKLTSTVSVVITLTDVNEAAPVFGSGSYTANVAESEATGTSVSIQ